MPLQMRCGQAIIIIIHSAGGVFGVILFRMAVVFSLLGGVYKKKSSRPRIEIFCKQSFREEKRAQMSVLVRTDCMRFQRRPNNVET